MMYQYKGSAVARQPHMHTHPCSRLLPSWQGQEFYMFLDHTYTQFPRGLLWVPWDYLCPQKPWGWNIHNAFLASPHSLIQSQRFCSCWQPGVPWHWHKVHDPQGCCPGLGHRYHLSSFSENLVVCFHPKKKRFSSKLTWAEETSVPNRGDKISKKTKHKNQIHTLIKVLWSQ